MEIPAQHGYRYQPGSSAPGYTGTSQRLLLLWYRPSCRASSLSHNFLSPVTYVFVFDYLFTKWEQGLIDKPIDYSLSLIPTSITSASTDI